jgi:microsomal dipeptidase-like Zn-dependent dipeptidase
MDSTRFQDRGPTPLDDLEDLAKRHASLQTIPDLLRGRGYSETDVERIMHGNWLRLLRKAWKVWT